MIAYKATYNFKCLNQEYKVGKTYTSDRMKICAFGFHFCQKMEEVLNYYDPSSDFILLEVEILGKIETKDDKSVTDKLKVLRVIPFEEYTDTMKSRFPKYEYDERNNLISETYPSGKKWTYKYDERNNRISETHSSGNKYTYKYDERNNLISMTYLNGAKTTYEYDERNNRISETNPDGVKTTYEYDERNNKISKTHPSGVKQTFEYAVITEE
jgi:YD repeat-containing protein